MFKICFIKLKETWQADQYSDPPLGLLYIMAVTKNIYLNNKLLDVKFLDMAHENEIPEADIYAMSICTLGYNEAYRVAKEIKKKYPNSYIIIGGPHVNVFPVDYWESHLDKLPFDIICLGEGEKNIIDAIEYIKNNKDKNTKKIFIRKDQIQDLDSIPSPAREFLDKNYYFKTGKVFGAGRTFNESKSGTMMTSRGCSNNCAFCASPLLWGRKVRYRNPESVKKELELLKKEYGVNEIRFQDDCFSLNFKRFKELANILKESGVRYRCSSRVDHINDEILNMLWGSGCRELGFGIEAAEDHVLKLINKGTTVAQNKAALKKAKAKGFKTRAFIMTGLPGETKDSAKHMIEFLEDTQPDVVTLTSFTPLPGCDIYNNPEKYGITILDKNWSKYDIAIKEEANVPFVHRLSTATLEEMEANREMLKEYIFNKGISNVKKYNKPYKRGESQ